MEPQPPKIEIPLPPPDLQKIGSNLELKSVTEKIESHTVETVKQSIQAVSQVSTTSTQTAQVGLDVLPEYTKNYSEEAKQKIEELLQVAADKGLDAANSNAEGQLPYILDAFHDALAEKLLPYLKQQGIIK